MRCPLADIDRVPLPREEVRDAIFGGDLEKLLAADQLQIARSGGLVFGGYEEGPITFSPTYKYDNSSTEYDTSEKQRVPSWTDRILYRGPDVRLTRRSCDATDLCSST